jgi:hypothetical protein
VHISGVGWVPALAGKNCWSWLVQIEPKLKQEFVVLKELNPKSEPKSKQEFVILKN